MQPQSAAFFLVAALPLAIGISQLLIARSQKRWIATQGRVLESYVMGDTPGPPGTRYPVVRYEYEIENRRFESSRFSLDNYSLGNNFGYPRDVILPGSAKAIVEKYPVGKVVTVYVHPGDWRKSVLQLGASAGTYVWLFFGSLFLAGTIVIWIFFG